MTRNLVICSDGTGNTFRRGVSNVSRLIKAALDLSHPEKQLVFYDQGIGTNPHDVDDVINFKEKSGTKGAGLEILDPPHIKVARLLATPAGLATGYGLGANLQEMYHALAKYHQHTDRIFLFGFSRGAFTVRALAGLLYRCGLPAGKFAKDDKAFRDCFAEAYDAYRPHCEDWGRIAKFRNTYEATDVEVHFLGIWDTVKSYGFIRPRSLPHLRHNPIVKTVCHALALNERRSWFLPTSWGGIDGDARNASSLRNDSRYNAQKVKEVWFLGCHSDIGGGDEEADTAQISFRWMLGEATYLILRPDCESWIFAEDAKQPKPHESYDWRWWISDRIPRWELDNSTRPPGYPFKWQGKGQRCIEQFRRGGNLYFHSSVAIDHCPGIVSVKTSPLQRTGDEPTL